MTYALGLLVAVFSVSVMVETNGQSAAVVRSDVIEYTNTERVSHGGAQLKEDEFLTSAAQLKAEDMAEKQYFAHQSPDGVTPWYWLEVAGYEYLRAGENLAVHFNESDKVVRAWMNSPSHRENILNNGYTEIGVGIATSTYDGIPAVFVAQFFGTPALPELTRGESFLSWLRGLGASVGDLDTTSTAPQSQLRVVSEQITVSPYTAASIEREFSTPQSAALSGAVDTDIIGYRTIALFAYVLLLVYSTRIILHESKVRHQKGHHSIMLIVANLGLLFFATLFLLGVVL